MNGDRPVRSCMCFPHSFEDLKTLSVLHQWRTVGDITAAVGCGGKCTLCVPYLEKMLETGETAFAVIKPNSN